ncbi:MAG: PEGA domain-containing protein [Deltaproteobacteria bacterium]|nr:PEGA domain-containing protein [Deltaproteobacteria bacterium]
MRAGYLSLCPGSGLVAGCSVLLLLSQLAAASGPPVAVLREGAVPAAVAGRIEAAVQGRRVVKPLRPVSPSRGRSAEEVAAGERVAAISLALERARQRESEAAWDECAREAAGAMGDAIELLAGSNELGLLRDLHVQIGSCMTLGQRPANARPHFLAAALLDESEPPTGIHRQEAEEAREEARREILARSRGPVRIETDPAGAEVWIDGRKAPGTTPLSVDVRLGDHFVTLRRFRAEPRTERRVLQPASAARFALEEVRLATLHRQLEEVAAGSRRVPAGELRLGQAQWAGAEQLLVLSARPGAAAQVRIELIDATSGKSVRSPRALALGASEEDLGAAVCAVLGESCAPPSAGIPWYVWPLAGIALVGGAVALGFGLDSAREAVFCPRGGCD